MSQNKFSISDFRHKINTEYYLYYLQYNITSRFMWHCIKKTNLLHNNDVTKVSNYKQLKEVSNYKQLKEKY